MEQDGQGDKEAAGSRAGGVMVGGRWGASKAQFADPLGRQNCVKDRRIEDWGGS